MIKIIQAGGREGSRDYGAETAIFISTLIVLYLLAVVFLVRRQINQVGIFFLCLLNLVGLFIWIAVEGEEDKTVPEQLFSMFN